jgi:hypothetical protein
MPLVRGLRVGPLCLCIGSIAVADGNGQMSNFFEVFKAAPTKVLFSAYFLGLLWGIGGLSFGLVSRIKHITIAVINC